LREIKNITQKQEKMVMKVFRRVSIMILFSLIFLPLEGVLAQGPPMHGEEREKIRENIETLRMWRLLETLELTSEQSTKFLPALKEFQDAKKSFADKRGKLMNELEAALESEKNNEKKIKDALMGLETARREFQNELERFSERKKEILSLKQQAKYFLFEEKFEKRLRETIHRMRGKGQGWKEME
jgi:hypothetical protein